MTKAKVTLTLEVDTYEDLIRILHSEAQDWANMVNLAGVPVTTSIYGQLRSSDVDHGPIIDRDLPTVPTVGHWHITEAS